MRGAVIAGGSDWSVSSFDAFEAMEHGITRSLGRGLPALLPEQSLTLQDMVDAYTINAAYALKQEKTTGSLEAGKRGDFIILDRDIFALDPFELHTTQVRATYLDGPRGIHRPRGTDRDSGGSSTGSRAEGQPWYIWTMGTRISIATARLDDPEAMARFLAPIPNGDDLAKVLHTGESTSSRAYDDASWTARYVVSDGTVVKCFAVTDITIDQAEMIAAVSLDSSAWDEASFREAVAQALGPTFDPAD